MQSHITIDHRKIKRGVEERGGHPASVKSTGGKGDAGILRINLPGNSADDELDDISWDELFAQVEEKQLAFLYQDRDKAGHVSRFNKMVRRDSQAALGA